MKYLAALAVVVGVLGFAVPAQAHIERPGKMTSANTATGASSPVASFARSSWSRGRVRARAAHWKATWYQIDNNLIATKLDDSCGNGVGYCNGGMYANFGSWAPKHSVRTWIGWNEAQQCLFCDTNWSCTAHVRVVAHWEGGVNSARYNIKEVYSYGAGNPGDGRCKVPWEFV